MTLPTFDQVVRKDFLHRHALDIIEVDAEFTVRGHDVVLCDASGGGFTVNLPPAGTNKGYVFTIKKTESSVGVITVDGNGSETIDGSTTYSLSAQYDTVTVVSDGSNWMILSSI